MPTMLAALHDGAGKMSLRQVPVPQVGPGEALVKVHACGICGSDLLNFKNAREPEKVPSGHEVAGEVVEVGAGVTGLRVGDRVAVETVGEGRACGDCFFCRQGQYRQCLHRVESSGGGFARYVKRFAHGCHKLPASLSWEEGALVEPFAVGLHGARRGGVKGGDTVVVLGAGNIGLACVAAARCMGAGKVLATARHPQQKEMALRLGADEVLSPEGPELIKAVEAATSGLGADVVLETVGGYTADTFRQAVAAGRMQARIVVLGGFRQPVPVDLLEPLLKEQSILFSSCYSATDGRHEFDMAAEFMASGRAKLAPMVTHRFPLERINEAFAAAYDKSTRSIKVQVFPWS